MSLRALLVLLLALLPARALSGEAAQGIDLVILIDQSGSMWGMPGEHPGKNDRYDHRIGIAQNIVHRFAEHVEDTPLVHRLAVVDFGDVASVALPAQVLRFDPADPGRAARTVVAAVRANVTAKHLVNTNTPAAMKLGFQELDKMARADPGVRRRRAMLILTDGRALLPGVQREEMRRRVREQAEQLRTAGIELWVVGLNDADDYWNQGDGEFWTEIAGPGHARLAETAARSIATIVQDIGDDWLGTKSRSVTGGTYQCPPYLRRLAFNVHFGVPRATVEISDPAGRAVPIAAGDPVPGTFARYVIDDPAPGTYRIVTATSRAYTVFAEEYGPTVVRLAPINSTPRELEVPLVFRATDHGGDPIVPLSGWPIKATAHVRAPSGATVDLPASFDGDGKFKAAWGPTETGSHVAALHGTVRLPDGSDYAVFADDPFELARTIEVGAEHVVSLRFEGIEPSAGVRLSPWQDAVDIRLTLTDAAGAALPNFADVIRDPASWLTVERIHKSGVPLADPLPLAYDDGEFHARLPVALDWTHGEGWWTPGELNLRVRAQPGGLAGGYLLDRIALPADAEALRIDGDPLSVGPLAVWFPWWVWLATFGIGAVMALGLGALALMRLAPAAVIWWSDSRRAGSVQLKIYDGDKDPSGVRAMRLRADGRARFRYDRQVSVSVDGREYVARRFRVRRVPSSDQVLAELEYVWDHEPEKTQHSMVVQRRTVRLKGLPAGGFLIGLDVAT